MGAVMGMGSTHWPAMIQPDEAKPWPFLRTLARDPRVPEALKHSENWPEGVQREYGDDEGVSAHREHRRRLVEGFRTLRAEIDAFQPDVIVMFGDDQYENFTEDIVHRSASWLTTTLPVIPSKTDAGATPTSGASQRTSRSACRAVRTLPSGWRGSTWKPAWICPTPTSRYTGRAWARLRQHPDVP